MAVGSAAIPRVDHRAISDEDRGLRWPHELPELTEEQRASSREEQRRPTALAQPSGPWANARPQKRLVKQAWRTLAVPAKAARPTIPHASEVSKQRNGSRPSLAIAGKDLKRRDKRGLIAGERLFQYSVDGGRRPVKVKREWLAARLAWLVPHRQQWRFASFASNFACASVPA